ncbi:hypothetical protein GMMP13_1030013 [Candidatus Magnetomoraceae bacterium gMMP-13]
MLFITPSFYISDIKDLNLLFNILVFSSESHLKIGTVAHLATIKDISKNIKHSFPKPYEDSVYHGKSLMIFTFLKFFTNKH